MARKRPRKLQQKRWDPLDTEYADLQDPEWLAPQVPAFFWEDEHNHRRYVTWLAQQLDIKTHEDWYRVSTTDITTRRGMGFLRHYNYSFIKALTKMLPQYEWHIWKFNYVSRRFWEDERNHVAYLRWLGEHLGYKKLTDWYQVSHQDFKLNHGKIVLESERESIPRIVAKLYPNHEWLPWLFNSVPRRYWEKKENRIRYMKWLGKQLGYKTWTDWYRLQKRDVKRNHGIAMLEKHYATNPSRAVMDCFPNQKWHPWLFNVLKADYWKIKKNRLAYLRWLGEKLKFEKPDDWYKIKEIDFTHNKGTTLFKVFYDGSPQNGPREMFPKKKWYSWLFQQTPKGFWTKKANRIEYLRWLGKKLGVRNESDWDRVISEDFRANRGSTLLINYGIEQLKQEAKSSN